MAKPAKIKKNAQSHRVPQNREEAVNMITSIGNNQRERQRLTADMDDEISVIRERYDKQINPLNTEIQELTDGLHTWAEANKDVLTNGGKTKTANMMTGEIKWRMRPMSCKAVRVKEAIEEIKQKGLAKLFIRTKEEINKEAILAAPDKVKGFSWISLEQGEDFVIEPFETNIEEVV